MTESTRPAIPATFGSAEWVGEGNPVFHITGLTHYARIPAEASGARRVPLVILAHGWGGNEASMWIFARLVPAGVAVVTPRAPLTLPAGDGYFWCKYFPDDQRVDAPSMVAAVKTLRHFVRTMPDVYPIDPEKIVLAGFSQGAMTGNVLALTEPEPVRGVASLAGAVPPLPPELFPAPSLNGLPVFIAHGTEDRLVPVSAAREAHDLFARLGADVTYGEYPVGHKMNSSAMNALRAWFAQVLSA